MLHRLGYTEREASWRASPATCTTSGNALARDDHAQTGAVMVYHALQGVGAAGHDLMPIVAAIANHEENEGDRGLARSRRRVILADKSDVHRSRVRNPDRSKSTSTTA